MEIKTYWGTVIFALEGAKTVLEVVKAAVEAKKSLRDAVLSGAVLSGAVLRGAVLRGAVLRGTDLRDADLSGADLSGAVLSGADLSGADLRGADLRDAVLSGAVLRGTDLRGTDLRGADLSGADLRGTDLRDAVLRGTDLSGGMEGVPVIPNIHRSVFENASKPDGLNMGSWHTCDTTHCRAGWVIALAGPAGKAMEWAMGTPAAAAIIYIASDPKLEKVPDFYCGNEEALADMKSLADSLQKEAL